MNTVFDAHCHVASAWAEAIGDFPRDRYPSCCCGTGPADWLAVQRTAGRVDGMVPAYGIHPWWLPSEDERPVWLNLLASHLSGDPGAVVGEIGLDFTRRPLVDHAFQRAVFLDQLKLAQRFRRVAVVHCVSAWGALCDVMDEVGGCPRGLVLHAYGGSPDMVSRLARYGAWFSLKMPLALDAKAMARIRAVPINRLLLESDATFDEFRSIVDTRTMLADALAPIASLLDLLPDQLAALATANALRCFRIGE